MDYLLFYDVSSDYLERRGAFRAEPAVEFAKADPYVRNGLVTRWRVREWTTVVGDAASTPVRPGTTPARPGPP